ncbi:hypothetical protein BH780_gp162 [Bacillus phage Eldridge]|uniref:Uncharacterized protein n=1 Tax=Bacillus phage Eldridge TaxID=1776293 RepID=A0A120HUP6_9CAUD|nr:hypothetical protein BH780_gp162 [Bacillus phage Eldridge]AMB18745.1 hypothetical protein Eldridge_0165 [Bacillus phage Eldridge]
MKLMTFKSGEKQAVVKEENGVVTVVRNGQETDFSSKHTFETLTDDFKAYGWEPVPIVTEDVQPTALSQSWLLGATHNGPPLEFAGVAPTSFSGAPLGSNEYTEITAYVDQVVEAVESEEEEIEIPAEIQKEVDDYLAMYDQLAEMQKKAKALKDSVRKYMEENDLKEIYGTKDRKVYLQDSTKSNSSSTFTDYDYHDLASVLKEPVLKDVTEMRVNADKLNSLLKTNKLPTKVVDRVKKLKIATPGTPQFKVKK